jgi:two-component system chemotaxis response regulator CheB
MLRILIADDSPTTRKLMAELIGNEPGMEVAGVAADGLEAVELTARLRPDLVTMDVRMPRLDGFEATRRIMVETPTPILIVTGSVDVGSVEVSMKALRMGALTVVPTPPGPGAADFEAQRRHFLDAVQALARVKVARRKGTPGQVPARSPQSRPRPFRVLAVAASTGGPQAIAQILAGLPATFPVPVLVVQHIARGFVAGFTSWLNTNSPLRVKVAEEGEPLLPRTVYVAPDDRHLGATAQVTACLSLSAPVSGARPSATCLFESVARAFGAWTLAVVLTGMGRDGVVGLAEVRRAGGWVLAQDEESSVVFGMPGAAVEAGLADEIVPLDMMAGRIAELAAAREQAETGLAGVRRGT